MRRLFTPVTLLLALGLPLLQYVQNGGAIFFIGDHYNADRNKNRWDGSECFNGYRRGAWTNPTRGMNAEEITAMGGVTSSDWLGTHFGVRFRYNALGNVTANDIVAPAQAFDITAGVATAAMHAGSTLAIMDPLKAKGVVYLPPTTAKWGNAVDQTVTAGAPATFSVAVSATAPFSYQWRRNGVNLTGATGAKTVTVKHAKYGTDASTTWSLWTSTNGGTTWLQTGSAVTTSTTTLATATFTVNLNAPIRFEIRKTDGTANRTNFDDFAVVGY